MFEDVGAALVMVAMGGAARYYWKESGGVNRAEVAGGPGGTRSFVG